MDIRNLITILNSLDDQDLDMRLYFTRKKPNGKYQSYSPTIDPDLQAELKGIVLKAIEKAQDVEQREFSPLGTIAGCIETYPTTEVTSFNDILESMNEDYVQREEISKEVVSKLTFYCLKFFTVDGDILFFRRVTKFNKLNKGGILGHFAHNDFKKLDDSLLGIDPSIDIVIFGDEMLILNHISLERIFSIQDQYQEKAGHTLEIVQNADKITNFEQFREDCLSDGRVTRALTKLLNEETRMSQVFENFENVISVIDIFGLNIELTDENTKIVYEDKSQLMDITRLMRDSFYKTYINNRDGFDEGI